MAVSTKYALASALKKMMEVKPLDKITVKDLVEICGVNRQTFYYHFDDVYDLLEWVFEEDANHVLPKKVIYENWRQDVLQWFRYLRDNSTFALNVYNSNNRQYMLRYIEGRMRGCISGFADIVSEGMNIAKQDYDYIIDFYACGVTGIISRWMDMGMPEMSEQDSDRFLKILDNSVENMLARFEKK